MARAPELLAYLKALEESLDLPHLSFSNKDTRFLPEMVDGLNGADPRLKLDLYAFDTDHRLTGLTKSGLVTRLKKGMAAQESWQAVLDHGGRHRIALSLKCTQDAVSVIVVDSLPHSDLRAQTFSDQWAHLEGQLMHYLNRNRSAELPPAIVQSRIIFSGVQKSQEGCCVFALSAAKKMAAEPDIQAMHDQTLEAMGRGEFEETVPTQKSDALPPSFIKHSTSATEIRQYEKARSKPAHALSDDAPQAVVNRKGQTLQQRHAAHEVTRIGPLPPLTFTSAILECLGIPREPISVRYSNSYEHKRIEFVRGALAHIAPLKEPSDMQ
ncbi:hypothetical protein AVMA1855_08475 [Acidovorax sp. SUPP1855]|uniref:YopJ family acetyltransferase n=1 Tax=Acidovorax sp. SUPP1855 TaxID=431774 RepID=UPI0023DE1F80|nr:YopJ family acetyltransferase [Acidovorax sp. SUPP1855]GKS84169.1 hypothetical protein AVMA1855_08475 [Acidovorax sp. SUPP1855]